ncbi:GNAT family N-acetyltransferase [Mycolicibacterium arenosum]|uniref:GNAT family N-acetyltransferase n=1 Tax=Mycolicibacterium arenosum TaxID=2952157 RepID=A0ABT1LZQ4_9MYCO|nr:GNAT family protein [Mycolicibacterium sp. CAU 1645]MCP9272388.1 GNAT family N-acetyltransferase [Mycolicibacterium sp. CAU 1645]
MTFAIAPATADDLEAFQRDPAEFAARIDSPVPVGWPEFPEAFEFTVDKLRESPAEADWWMHLFFDDGLLVGSGGFVGPPDDGVVEIGYEIAPELRGRGYATAAARAMVAKAVAAGVHTVIAHTMPEENPSTGVLRKLGFRHTGEATDPDEGSVWKWELAVP